MPGAVYIVRDGRLRVHHGDADVAYLRKGDFFGEASVARSRPRSATVNPVVDSELLTLPAPAYRELLDSHPDLAKLVERRIASYEYKQVARVPLDFTTELLPAESGVFPALDPASAAGITPEVEAEADEGRRSASWGSGCGPALPARLAGGRDGLRGGVPGDGLPALRPPREPRAHPQVVHTTVDGTSLAGITRGAGVSGSRRGRSRRRRRGSDEMPLPAIVHWEGNHWVVLYDVTAGTCASPTRPRRPAGARARSSIEKWTGYAALFDYATRSRTRPCSEPNVGWTWPFFRPTAARCSPALLLALVAAGAADGDADLHPGDRRQRAHRGGLRAARRSLVVGDARRARADDGRRSSCSATSSAARPCASTRPRSTSSPAGCSRCR